MRTSTGSRLALTAIGVAVMTLAIGCCLLLGTVGWFAVGFGTLTDCTDSYSRPLTQGSPCPRTGHWIDAGGLAQWLVAGVGGSVLLRSLRAGRPGRLLAASAAILALSVLTFVGTSRQADRSYCRPGTPDYSATYCG